MSAILPIKRLCIINDTSEIVSSRQISESGNAGMASIVDIRGDLCRLFNQSTAHDGRSLGGCITEGSSCSNTVTYEQEIDVVLRINRIRLTFYGTINLETAKCHERIAIAVVAVTLVCIDGLLHHKTDVSIRRSKCNVGRLIAVRRITGKVDVHVCQVFHFRPSLVWQICSFDDDLSRCVIGTAPSGT